jgi:hypothetical protein
MKTNVNKKEGDQRLVVIGGVIPLDGYQMKHVTFKDAKITYYGGKTIMEDVLFINCTFDIVQQAPGPNFARSLLSSNMRSRCGRNLRDSWNIKNLN